MSAFILVTPPKVVNGEHDLLRDMLARGLPRLHVRKPGLSQSQLAEYLEAIPREYRHRVVLHQCHDYVASYRLGGRHFREADTPDGLLPALPGTATTSISLHVPDQLLTCKGAVDYCFLAPIYESISKAGHAPSPALQDRESLAGFLALSRYPVVALGGERSSE